MDDNIKKIDSAKKRAKLDTGSEADDKFQMRANQNTGSESDSDDDIRLRRDEDLEAIRKLFASSQNLPPQNQRINNSPSKDLPRFFRGLSVEEDKLDDEERLDMVAPQVSQRGSVNSGNLQSGELSVGADSVFLSPDPMSQVGSPSAQPNAEVLAQTDPVALRVANPSARPIAVARFQRPRK